ncbi:GNAT family N-acetyltransferase [Vibrio astriarenae]|uniref:GNAT family N-acetyltransferase n=1 Tax=Vibrio astriarenae TaxID=1481923 RepID=A0A7Z2T853_9VIBR|nr:GNAT family N-acetyltransferase [Vibrio astriarenae]QIA66055.1 GNAT family N-acetyltransferase [Vibrio astriarenae]
MKISLLTDHPEAVTTIAQWYFDEWAHTAPHITLDTVIEKVTEKASNRNKIPLAIIAHVEDHLAGVLELKIRENKNYPDYEHWIGGVYTHSAYRRQGIAGALIHRAKEMACGMGVKKLYLQCESFNIAFYKKLGFELLHTAQHHNVETTIMVWDTNVQSELV